MTKIICSVDETDINHTYYLLQVRLIENGEWHDARNIEGNIIIFSNDFDVTSYSKTDDFKERLGKYAKSIRVVQINVLQSKVGNTL